MEALRLLSSTGLTASVAGLAAEHNILHESHGQRSAAPGRPARVLRAMRGDAALLETHLADLLSAPGSVAAPTTTSGNITSSDADPAALSSGLAQLNKYLSRAWYRAGIPVQSHEDSSQAVYTTLLQHLGRPRFDALVSDVGHSGIKDVFTRETNEGVAFFLRGRHGQEASPARANLPIAGNRRAPISICLLRNSGLA